MNARKESIEKRSAGRLIITVNLEQARLSKSFLQIKQHTPNLMDTLAFKLTWLSKWKLQCESQLIDPNLTKLIGHYSVYLKAAQCMNEEDDAASNATVVDETLNDGNLEDFEWRSDEDHRYSGFPSDPSPDLHPQEHESGYRARMSTVVSEVEINVSDEEEDSDPFSDDEESDFSNGEDDCSDSSVEEMDDRDNPPPTKMVTKTPKPHF
jgi:hypothetical protein